jgi:hypothetical protein
VTNVLMYKHTNGRTKLSKKVFKKPMDPNFEPLRSIGFNGHNPAKVLKFK